MALSLCMIVRNEAERLPRCLESVAAVVDEQVIVDTGSTDETMAIAQSYGATVLQSPWEDDFSAPRNLALAHATGDWVLVLDADETLCPDAVPAIRQAIQNDKALVVNLIRHEIGANQSPYSLVSRLFRRHPAIHFSRPYHALIDDSVLALKEQEPHWQIVDLPGVALAHAGYEPGAIVQQNKAARARAALETYLEQHPEDVYALSKLGGLLVDQGELEAGLARLKQGRQLLEAQPTPNPPLAFELHYHLGIARSRLQNPALAMSHYRVALKQPIGDRLKLGACINLGSLLKAKGDLAGATQCFREAVAIAPDLPRAHYNLGTLLRLSGNPKDAVRHFQQAIQLDPNHAESHQNLGVALLSLGRVRESLAAFRQAIALHEAAHRTAEANRIRQELQTLNFEV